MGKRFFFDGLPKTCIDEIARGAKIAAVARKYGVHRSTIHRWINRPEMKSYYEIRKMYEEIKTLERLGAQMESEDPWAALRAVKKVLRMTAPKQKKNVSVKLI